MTCVLLREIQIDLAKLSDASMEVSCPRSGFDCNVSTMFPE